MNTMNGTKVRIRSGSEGPSHDPYSYHEITVERLGREVTLHLGLAVWREIDGAMRLTTAYSSESEIIQDFVELTGGTPEQWQRWHAQPPRKSAHTASAAPRPSPWAEVTPVRRSTDAPSASQSSTTTSTSA